MEQVTGTAREDPFVRLAAVEGRCLEEMFARVLDERSEVAAVRALRV